MPSNRRHVHMEHPGWASSRPLVGSGEIRLPGGAPGLAPSTTPAASGPRLLLFQPQVHHDRIALRHGHQTGCVDRGRQANPLGEFSYSPGRWFGEGGEMQKSEVGSRDPAKAGQGQDSPRKAGFTFRRAQGLPGMGRELTTTPQSGTRGTLAPSTSGRGRRRGRMGRRKGER
jgi:hypothetical protein